MDAANLFETRTTARLLRAEFGVAGVACAVLMAMHWDAVNWLHAALLFGYIDLIGYLPGALAYRRSQGRPLPRRYYVLYNVAHSFLTAAVVAAAWALVVGPEWALLAIPVHLCGDRSLFGNFMKPFAVEFEPAPHPAYAQLRRALAEPVRTPTSSTAPVRVPAGGRTELAA